MEKFTEENEDIITKLLEKYPTGFVGGSVIGIVKQYGMAVQWVNPDFTTAQVNLLEGDDVSITHVRGNMLEIARNGEFSHAIVSPKFFKKFVSPGKNYWL